VNGTLVGYDEAMLTPKVDGRIQSMYVDVGDKVYPGQVLMVTDRTDYQLAVNDARRALEAELATIDLKEIPEEEFDVEAVPMVRRAEASLINARRQYNRLKDLTGVSRTEVDAAETELKVAEANKRDAVATAKARLASARWRKASLDIAEQRLQDCELRTPMPALSLAWGAMVGSAASPLRYTVAYRLASVGDMVRSMPVTNVFKLVITESLKLRAPLPEKYSQMVKVGQTVDLRVVAFPGEVFPGVVARIHPTVDESNRTFLVEIQIPNSQDRLKIGNFAQAKIKIDEEHNRPTVPANALVRFAGVNKIFLIDNNVAKEVPVEVGTRETDWVEVIGTIPPGARVATSSFSQLADGTPVKIRQ
jgi:multidrug efflux pump subunit AcrA (membrane-fusion protein)